ncbi:hypothetical protein Tco_0305333 [Tanacetum coccineum]
MVAKQRTKRISWVLAAKPNAPVGDVVPNTPLGAINAKPNTPLRGTAVPNAPLGARGGDDGDDDGCRVGECRGDGVTRWWGDHDGGDGSDSCVGGGRNSSGDGAGKDEGGEVC